MQQFDPSYGYTFSALLEVDIPKAPDNFSLFWQTNFEQTQHLATSPRLDYTGRNVGDFQLHDLSFQSTDNTSIYGWALIPTSKPIRRVVIVGHGYGGCEEPSANVPLLDCAYLFICYRGISRSRRSGLPEDPRYHVLYNIHDKDQYIIRGCVEDTWMAVSAAEELFPSVREHIGFMGISFSGGLGALALPWDKRIKKAHLQVPTFGNQPLRLKLPSWGSANAVQNFYKQYPEILETLHYYDAAIAASYAAIPVHIAAALADPVVAPPGQFSIYNNLASDKTLFVLEKGHSDYPNHKKEQAALLTELSHFFADL